MGYSFDGTNKIISLTLGTTTLDVRDAYSRWKDWDSDNIGTKFLQAFSVVGGDPINESEGIYVTSYFFLLNGWRIRPQEANHTLTVENGILLTDTGADPFILTLGTYEIQIKYSQPIKSETIQTAGTGGGLTTDENTQLMDKVLTTAKFLALK